LDQRVIVTYTSAGQLSPAVAPPRGDLSITSPTQGPAVSSKNLAAHLQVDLYGSFQLTNAVRPALDLPVIPCEGFRINTYHDPRAGLRVPVIAASVSRERLFDAFLALLEPLHEVVDVVLETSHDQTRGGHCDLLREHIDRPVLESHFCEFEDLLVNDGCTGVAVIGIEEPVEVQFDEHKLLVVYARDLKPFESILKRYGVRRNDAMKLITEGEHLHTSQPRFHDEFGQLCYRLGVGEAAEHVNW
jgi:hypothetical protein